MSISTNLRARTGASHIALESCGVLKPLSSPGILLEEYKVILEKFYGFFKPLESEIQSVAGINDILTDFNERRKVSWLERDIVALSGDCSAISLCQNLPVCNSIYSAFGAMYVMEGSTLGGIVISKLLADSLNLTGDTGASFFNGYNAETGKKWKSFKDALEGLAKNEEEENEIIDTAVLTFSKFKNWLDE